MFPAQKNMLLEQETFPVQEVGPARFNQNANFRGVKRNTIHIKFYIFPSFFQIFHANTDASTPVTSSFPNPVFAQIVRITCLEFEGYFWPMRFEILGCKN